MAEWLIQGSIIGTILATIIGAVIGSFGNVVIVRLPQQLQRQWRRDCKLLLEQPLADPEQQAFNIAVPRSHCPNCQTTLSWYDNIPLVSQLLLGSRCRHCKAPIAARYAIIEALSAALFGALAWYQGVNLDSICFAIVGFGLLLLFMIDAEHQLLPDVLTLGLLWLVLWWSAIGGPIAPEQAIIGAVAGYLSLWSVYWLFKALTGKDGLGFGDFKLLALITAMTGITLLPVTIILSSVVGALFGGLLLIKNGRSQPIPFGPFLIVAGIISYFYGQPMLTAYWQWLLS